MNKLRLIFAFYVFALNHLFFTSCAMATYSVPETRKVDPSYLEPTRAWAHKIETSGRCADATQLKLNANVTGACALASRESDALLIFQGENPHHNGLFSVLFEREWRNFKLVGPHPIPSQIPFSGGSGQLCLTSLKDKYLLVYLGREGAHLGLYSSVSKDGLNWSDPTKLIAQTQGYHMCPMTGGPISIATSDNKVLLVYRAHDGQSEGLFSSISEDGLKWSNPARLVSPSYRYHMCPVPNGPISIACVKSHWGQKFALVYRAHNDGPEGLFSSVSADGRTWSDPTKMVAPELGYHMCPVGNGPISLSDCGSKLILIYKAELDGQHGLFSSLSEDGKTWSEPHPLKGEIIIACLGASCQQYIGFSGIHHVHHVSSYAGAEQDLGGYEKSYSPIIIYRQGTDLFMSLSLLSWWDITYWGRKDYTVYANY